jgi:hypothetical protein
MIIELLHKITVTSLKTDKKVVFQISLKQEKT